MTYIGNRFITFVCLYFIYGVCCEDDFEGLSTFTVYHSFDQGSDPVFVKRGTVNVQSLKGGNSYFTPDGGLTSTDLHKLKTAARENGIYRIQVPNRVGTGHVMSFVKACALYESNLSDTITVHVDQAWTIIAVSITTPLQYCTLSDPYGFSSNFNTSVEVVQTVNGPTPETQTYIQKLEQEKAEKAKGQQQDNRSFLAKYWMYLVPLVLFLMMANYSDQGGAGR